MGLGLVTCAPAGRVVPLYVDLHVSRVGHSAGVLSFRDSSEQVSALEQTRLVVFGAQQLAASLGGST
jgi:hypothetical protein